MKTSILILTTVISSMAMAASNLGTEAMKLVPNSKIAHEKGDEVKLQTAQGGMIEIDFDRKGVFSEASGTNADQDVFNAPNQLLSLKDAVAAAKKAGKTPAGKWSLEKETLSGWVYEFAGFENGKEMEYIVDAKTGALKKSKTDRL